jgi:uncharacterized membrane protein YhfC
MLGLSAGLLEESARYLVLRYWLRRDRSWRAALMFGAGHGGVESFLLGVLAALGAISVFVLRNVDPVQLGVPPDRLPTLQAQLDTAWNVPPWYPLLGAFERVLAIATHLFLSVLVMQAFLRRNLLWLTAAILWHTLFDALAVYAVATWGIVRTEAIIAVPAVLGLVLMFALRGPEPPEAESVSSEPIVPEKSAPS